MPKACGWLGQKGGLSPGMPKAHIHSLFGSTRKAVEKPRFLPAFYTHVEQILYTVFAPLKTRSQSVSRTFVHSFHSPKYYNYYLYKGGY